MKNKQGLTRTLWQSMIKPLTTKLEGYSMTNLHTISTQYDIEGDIVVKSYNDGEITIVQGEDNIIYLTIEQANNLSKVLNYLALLHKEME